MSKKIEEFVNKIDCSAIPSVNVNYSPYDLSNYYIQRYNKWIKLGNKLGIGIVIFNIILSFIDSFRGNNFFGTFLLFLFILLFIHFCINLCLRLLGIKKVIDDLRHGNFKYCDTVIINHSTDDNYFYEYDKSNTYYSGKKNLIHFRDTNLLYEVDLFSRYPVGTNVVLLVVNKKYVNGQYQDTILEVFKKC